MFIISLWNVSIKHEIDATVLKHLIYNNKVTNLQSYTGSMIELNATMVYRNTNPSHWIYKVETSPSTIYIYIYIYSLPDIGIIECLPMASRWHPVSA